MRTSAVSGGGAESCWGLRYGFRGGCQRPPVESQRASIARTAPTISAHRTVQKQQKRNFPLLWEVGRRDVNRLLPGKKTLAGRRMCDMGQLISKHFKCIKWIPEREITRLFTAAIFQHGGLAEGETRGGLQSRRPGRGGKGTTQLKFLTVGSLKLLTGVHRLSAALPGNA